MRAGADAEPAVDKSGNFPSRSMDTNQIRCGAYISPKKRPKFGYDEFVKAARVHGVIIVDLDLEGDVSNLPTNLDAILHKARVVYQ